MKIAMFTNTYLPHVGGVAKSVHTLETACRAQGHEVRIVAPEFEGAEPSPEVLRVPAIQHFNGSDFCVRLPVPNIVRDFIEDFQPDLIHSHHPFLLGDAALRESWKIDVPILFTHHTLYERYTHYVPLDSPALKRIAVQLSVEYCNLCDQIIAPSESVAALLAERGVTTPIEVVPTGVEVDQFANGDGARFRKEAGIPRDATVIGHVGRLQKEKNLLFLAEAVAEYLTSDPNALFLLIGTGEDQDKVIQVLLRKVERDRILDVGKRTGAALADAYAAMDCFVFASQTETQGIVLAEAMAAGSPVIALDGPGVREIVKDGTNGLLLAADASAGEFAAALKRLLGDEALLSKLADAARETAEEYRVEACVQRMLDCYQRCLSVPKGKADSPVTVWDRFLNGMEIEWELFTARMTAIAAAMNETQETEASLD